MLPLRLFISPSALRVAITLCFLLASTLSWPGALPAHADDVSVPVSLQIDLLGRVTAYERNYASRRNAEALVLVAVRRNNPESVRVASQVEASLRRNGTLGGRRVRTLQHNYTDAAALRAAVDANGAAIAYITPGMGDQIAAIARSLNGATVMSVSAVGADAARGIVLSFELVAARPTLVVNLPQAERQGMAFSSQFLRLARVIR